MKPEECKYSKDHMWVAIEGDEIRTGISDHAQRELGDLVFVELPETGRQVAQGDSIGSLESVKTVGDLYAPVSGEIVEVNDLLTSKPETLNEDPHGEGWIIRIKMSNPGELDGLMDYATYQDKAPDL
jgi:glycine cleavage system H protein